jgi:hypothetical protein
MASKKSGLKRMDLAAATKASVQAALKKAAIAMPKPGTLAGFYLDEAALGRSGVAAEALAKSITAEISAATGIRLRSGVVLQQGGVLIGYAPPALKG